MLTHPIIPARIRRFLASGGWAGRVCDVGELVLELRQAGIGDVCGGVLRRDRAAYHQGWPRREKGEYSLAKDTAAGRDQGSGVGVPGSKRLRERLVHCVRVRSFTPEVGQDLEKCKTT